MVLLLPVILTLALAIAPYIALGENTGAAADGMAIIALEDTEAMSKVAEARVFIDGAYAGDTDRAGGRLQSALSSVEHTVLISKKGLVNTTATVRFVPGGEYTVILPRSAKKYSIFDSDLFYSSLTKELFNGAVNTIKLSIISFSIGLAIGLAMGIGRVSPNAMIRGAASVYVQCIRGIPILLLLLFIKYGLPFFVLDVLGYRLILDAFMACVIAISMNCGAYMGEIFKAGIKAIHVGQVEAARSLGMTHWQSLRYVVLPQAFKVVLPALGNEFVSVIKGSSIGLVIAYPEIIWWSNSIGAEAFNTFTPLLAAGIIYLSLTIPLGSLIRHMEAKLSVGDAGAAKTGWFGKKREAGEVRENIV